MTTHRPNTPPALTLPPVPTQLITVSDGSRLTITGDVPTDVSERRARVRGAQLYCIAGLLTDPHNPLAPARYTAAYLGKSSALYRANTSFTSWVITQRRLQPVAIALLHREDAHEPDVLSALEARCIQLLSTGPGNVVMLNRHTSANLASARLSRTQITTVQDLAAEIADHLWRRMLASTTNPHPGAPASNARELAIRCILAADRAVDVPDIVALLTAAGHHSTGNTPEFSTRRDLLQREDRGRPRIPTTWHRHRRLFWPPRLPKHTALARYDQAKPARTAGPRTTISCRPTSPAAHTPPPANRAPARR